MYDEDDLLPISALQHLLFCERQAALIHVEQLWAENELTVQGRQLHERADSGRRELLRGRRAGVRVERAVPLRSLALGVWGKADVVEFAAGGGGAGTDGAGGMGGSGGPPVPVEYKRGKPKSDGSDAVQLCAQAMCLEEMLGVAVPAGAIFYGQTRRREPVAFDAGLRRTTADAAARLHELVSTGATPPAALMPKCRRCSLIDLCQPRAVGRRPGQHRSAAEFARRAVAESLASLDPAGDAEPQDA